MVKYAGNVVVALVAFLGRCVAQDEPLNAGKPGNAVFDYVGMLISTTVEDLAEHLFSYWRWYNRSRARGSSVSVSICRRH